MEKKLIVRIAAGLGNQMFMYAHAFALSKSLGYELFIDNTSSYFQKKNLSGNRSYKLNYFNIHTPIIDKNSRYDNYYKHNLRKFFKFIDKFKKNKSFLIEHQDKKKITFFKKDSSNYKKKLYVEGYYECEKYFIDFRRSLINQFTIKNNLINIHNKYIDLLSNSNSVSIHIRRNRFIEPEHFTFRGLQTTKSIHLNDVFSYINRAVSFFEKKINNPKFFIWSNNFSDLDTVFDKNKFIFVENNSTANDFHLFKFSKHFIVSPSSFHWWGAWLNQYPNKICVRPSNDINPSNNKDFWPENWLKI